MREIDGFMQETAPPHPHRGPGWRHRAVKALYFGGGTANLTPAEPFRALCQKLAGVFDLSGAEITLEGVPAYFVERRPLLIDILPEETRARHFRISMGLQTFDVNQLRRMGRLGFGTPETFAEVVRQGHARGFTVSADLLFNLPGQTLVQMRQDVQRALDLGLDHICLYHLVLFEGLGTEWSCDPALVASLPANEVAVDHWLALRELLLSNGYYQTTLTNFERVGFRGSDRRFLYEENAFRPEEHDMLGFGPAAYSLVAGSPFPPAWSPMPGLSPYQQDLDSAAPCYAVKTLNPDSAADYSAAVDTGSRPWESVFLFRQHDLKLLYLTRKIATLGVDRAAYRACFGSDCVEDFPEEFRALAADRLTDETAEAVRLTPRGMFYADTVAGLLAWRHVQSFRYRQRAAEAARQEGRPGRAHLLEFGRYAHLFSYMG
jgi:oxygen-independent coproporphyrinogen-3 oxidase